MAKRFVQGSSRIGALRACATAAALGLVGVLALAPPEALAGNCEHTKRKMNEVPASEQVRAHTVVRNGTSASDFEVTLSRGGTEKSSGTIGPSQQISKLSGVSGTGTFNIAIVPQGGAASGACSYQLAQGTADDGNTDYVEWIPNLPGGGVCDGRVKVSCDKSYHPGKQRWNTTFVITD